MFFERVHDAGGKYVLCHDSICYHHEAVERRSGVRPVGMENMQEGS
jgi:GT2 family glycosyltransferase